MKVLRVHISLLLFLCSLFASGQNQTIDSLIYTAQLTSSTDSLNINKFFAWQKAFNEVKESGSEYRIVEICAALGDYFFENGLYENAIEYYSYIFNTKIDTGNKSQGLIKIYRKIGQSFSNVGKPDSALYYYNQIFDEYEFPKRLEVIRDLVEIYANNGDHRKSLEYNLIILDLLVSSNASKEDLSKIYNNIGFNYHSLGQYGDAIANFSNALTIYPLLSDDKRSSILRNLGISHFNSGNYQKSIDYLIEAFSMLSDNLEKSEVAHLIATVYQADNDFFNSLSYFERAEVLAKAANNQELLADIYAGYAVVYNETQEYDLAFENFKNHSRIRDSLKFLDQLNQKRILDNQKLIERTEKQNRIFKAQQDFQKLKISQLETQAYNQKLQNAALRADSIRAANELDIARQKNEIAFANERNNELEIERQKGLLKVTSQQLEIARTNEEKATIEREKQKKVFELAEQTIDLQKRDVQLKEEQIANEANAREIERRKTGQRNSLIIAALLAALAIFILWAYRNKRKDNTRLSLAYNNLNEAQGQLKAAETKIRGLLNQQVSGAVAAALMTDNNPASDDQQFVSVMFVDIRDFTVFCEGRKPAEIIEYQNSVFSFMIDIIEDHHGVVNQLMGDGFMATFGAPISEGNDCLNAYNAAHKILKILRKMVAEKKIHPTKIGIGVHAGHVVTGNVGNERRKQFSITGNTVILAARLEQLNKEFGTSFVFSRELYDALPEEERKPIQFRPVMVKGRSSPIEVAAF